jgi:uncharacterized radical SAM superfamily Fe-S cluster-containing enzyme
MTRLNQILSESLLKTTTSRCNYCKELVPAEVYRLDYANALTKPQVMMRKDCAEHGIQETLLAKDAQFYWLAQGNPINQNCCGLGNCCSSAAGDRPGYLGKNALEESKHGTIDKLSTCLALIEIVDSCNLSCPTCFANSPLGIKNERLKYHPLADIKARIEGVLAIKGQIEILQLSGGEPTLHPDFFDLIEWIRSNSKIDYLLINTNGVRLAKDLEFTKQLGELFKRFDNIQIYLQFDGTELEGQLELRGADLRAIRQAAILNCAAYDLPITLAMTVTELTLPQLWQTVSYGLQFEHVRGVSFQPCFLSGRIESQVPTNNKSFESSPISVGDIILALNAQSSGAVALQDFTPLPCGDPNCATIGWRFRLGDKSYSPSTIGIDLAELQKNFPDRVNYNIEDLQKCGCDNSALGSLMKKMELKESNAFRLFIKPFMDVRSWDEDRIDRCCTHVIRPDGKLDSFCRYYLKVNQ